MKALLSACGALAALGTFAPVWAQQSAVPQAAPATPAAPAAAQDEKMDAKALAAAAAEAEAARMRVEYAEGKRLATAYFPKAQARLKVYSVSRFDPEMAKPREYFLLELTGSAIVEPVVLNLEDGASIQTLIGILERFESESRKSNDLKEKMGKRKTELGGDLSREETRLVDLQSAATPDAEAVAKSKARVAAIKDELAITEDLGKMDKISGVLGTAKLNLDRPSYEFVASMEPTKSVYTLKAGYSFQVSAKEVKYYVDLLKKAPELKGLILENEAYKGRLKDKVDSLFKAKEG